MKRKNVEKLYIEPCTYIRRRSWKEEEQVSHWDIRAGGRLGEREWAWEGERCSTLPTQGRCFQRRRLRSSAPHRGPGYSPYTVRHSPPPSLPAPPQPAPLPRFSLHSRIAKTREQNSWKTHAQGGDGVQSVSVLHATPWELQNLWRPFAWCNERVVQDAGGNADCGVRRSLFRATKTLHAFQCGERASDHATIHSSIHGWNDTHTWMEYYKCYGWNYTYGWMEWYIWMDGILYM